MKWFHQPASRILLIVFLLSMTLVGCSPPTNSKQERDGQYLVTVVNNTDEPVYSVQFSMDTRSGGAINANGTPIEKGEDLTFDFDITEKSALWTILGDDDQVLARQQVDFDFDDHKEMVLVIEGVDGSMTLHSKQP
ncbi:hypothetical protein J0B03_07300 [Alkalibacter rhizosphaerae]|uniref:Uncharacterized protein n=1 Tax=Alkalibacter rhizosphaerae TaxID=2815577 RepID=A0A974XDH1_9FIRM|nr:hypothetical protein [Alkalibacter rhizosphaerae]QSX07641.1 hypothetical protein J0B03_07300 [Alkalibacter rhizosphaerae]